MTNQNTGAQYDEDYFLRGQETGKSLYKDYRWLPDLTIPMAERIADHLDMELDDSILDFGASRGFLVKALTEIGFDHVYGVDISRWAVSNCDEAVRGKVTLSTETPWKPYDWIISKDCLEHVPYFDLREAIHAMVKNARKGIFIVVPLADSSMKYVVPEYEKDITHVVRWKMQTWVEEFMGAIDLDSGQWSITAQHRIKGIKDNYAQFPKGNGFITIRKLQ